MPRASLRRGAIAASGVTSLTPPIRATFYYSWFTGGSNPTYPGSWEQGGVAPWTQYHPVRGYYDQANTSIIDAHIGDLLYGKFAAGIATWWGQGSTTDGEFQILLDRAAALGTGFRWCIYYEAEGNTIAGVTGSPNPTSAQITSDLNYITTNYTHHPNYLHVAGKPVIFAFGDPSDDNTVTTNILNRPAARWKTATNNAAEPWYYVLKVYVGYATDHATYPAASWHQYGPATAVDQQGSYSYNISPGFWLATETTPRLARDPTTFATNVRNMLAANVDWKLVTSYNEWGEGHPVEAADSGSGRNYVGSGWTSPSGRGTYLDTLNADGNTGGMLSDSGTCTASLTVTTGSEITITTAYVTGYTWFDNTPPGSATISDPIIHSVADGTGTYADPITVAVGWSTGPTVMDYDPGTIMYMPYLRRYFIVEDKCGDVVPPQNGPCHDLSTADAGATTWVDIWIDGQGGTESAVQNCANTITGIHTIIINPVSTYPVVSGSVYNNGCSQMY